MTMQNTIPVVLTASTLEGDKVFNQHNEEVGKVEEIMLDIHAGHVAYVVISFGGILGIGTKLFAVPWTALTVDTTRKCFVMDVDKDKLKNAPGFDKDNWPKEPSGQWFHDLYHFYGQQPYWSEI
ncbi:MAG TPA: PRC-barrel domain-containing protein [Phototrophicaceae bacterium]|nr:PRC-barrel domain-containing protein [Phototrophicaceae bacterium]